MTVKFHLQALKMSSFESTLADLKIMAGRRRVSIAHSIAMMEDPISTSMPTAKCPDSQQVFSSSYPDSGFQDGTPPSLSSSGHSSGSVFPTDSPTPR